MVSLETVDLDARHYEKNSKSQYESVKKILVDLDISPEAKVLDVGCGFGQITSEIAGKAAYGEVIGIDASTDMISLAKEKYPKLKFPNLHFYKVKAEDIHFQKEFFDIILCANTLLWVRKPLKALRLMCNSLKFGGVLSILTYCNDTPFAKLFSSVVRKYFLEFEHLSAGKSMLSKNEHRRCLESEGMYIEDLKLEDITYAFDSVKSFRDYVRGWQNCFIPLPSDDQEKFLDKIIEASPKYNSSQTSETFNFSHKSLTIKARKTGH